MSFDVLTIGIGVVIGPIEQKALDKGLYAARALLCCQTGSALSRFDHAYR
jgi:hypothetical protein